MTKILTAILAVVTVVVVGVASIGGLLVGGIVGPGGGGNYTVTVTVPGAVPGVTQVAIPASVIPAPITSTPLPPMGGTIYNRMIDFDAGITVDGATTTLATTTISHLKTTGAVVLGSDLTVNGTFSPAYISTSTTSTLATTSITFLELSNSLTVGEVSNLTGTTTITLGLTANGKITLGDAVTDEITVGGVPTFNATSTFSGALVASARSDLSKLIQGGSVEALSGEASSTLTSTQLCENSVLTHTASTTQATGGILFTITLPTITTLYGDCLATNGDMLSILFMNATSSYSASTTIARNTGIDLLEPSGGDVVILATESARLDFTRVSNTTTTVEVTSLQKAD